MSITPNNTGGNSNTESGKPDAKIAQNPNPRANENIRTDTEDVAPDPEATNQTGSEITDGEAG